MSLEFPCPHCRHVLRTGDDKAGRGANCPACGELIQVPDPHQLGGHPDRPRPLDREEPFLAEVHDVDDEASRTGRPVPRDDGGFRDETSLSHRQRVPTCPHCQIDNEPGARDCRGCGAELPTADPGAADSGGRRGDPDLGEILRSSWQIYTSEMGLLIGGWLLWMVMMGAAVVCCLIPVGIALAIVSAMDSDLVLFAVAGGALVALPLFLLGCGVLTIGYIHFNFNVARGTSAGVGDLLYGFGDGRFLIPGMVLVALVCTLANIPTCGLAAILLWPLWYADVFRRPAAGEALDAGFRIVRQEFVTVLVVGLIVAGISFMAGAIPYLSVLIMIFTLPFLELLHAVAYLRMERERIAVDRD